MNKYHEGKIYKMINNLDNKEYVGSTCRSLYYRLQKHITASTSNDYKVYIHFNNIGWNNVKIELVEDFECENRTELRIREQYWIEELNPELNDRRAYLSTEDKKAYDAKYRKENPEKMKSKNKKYRKENPEKEKERKKKYNDEHKDEIKKYNNKYYKEKNKEIINCECGGKYRFITKARHFKTKIHQKHLSTIQ